jgi:hypothetical protein
MDEEDESFSRKIRLVAQSCWCLKAQWWILCLQMISKIYYLSILIIY